MIVLGKFSKVFTIIGQIAAYLTVAIIGLLFINDGVYAFLPENVHNIMSIIREYAVLFTLIIVGFSFACKRSFILWIPFVILALVTLGFSFPALFK